MKIDIKEFENDRHKINISHFKLDNPKGALVVFPGAGYNHMGPCLYYPSNLFIENNFDIVNFEYDFRKSRPKGESVECYSEYLDFLLSSLADFKLPDLKIALSKSIGTRILGGRESDLFHKKLWLTPDLRNDFVVESISRYPYRSLVIIGTADPFYDEKTVNGLKKKGVECELIKDADHGLDIDNNVPRSLIVMGHIISAIKRFVFEDRNP